MKIVYIVAAAITCCLATSAMAQVNDPALTCDTYVKQAAKADPAEKTGNAKMDAESVDMERKLVAYCSANPKASVISAAKQVMIKEADHSVTCAAYLKQAATEAPVPSTGNASMDKDAMVLKAKVNEYCKANPKASALDAAIKAMGG